MQLSILPHTTNKWPFGGIIINGGNARNWLEVLNDLALPTNNLRLHPLPGAQPNSMAGCLIPLTAKQMQLLPAGPWQYFQVVTNNLFIAENATLFPLLSGTELEVMFGNNLHFAHPQFGWVQMTESVAVSSLFGMPKVERNRVTKPAVITEVFETVKAFMIAPVAPEETIEQLMGSHPAEKMPDEPLNIAEKLRLSLYKLVPDLLKKASYGNGILKNVATDYEKLLERNQAMADKLMKMLRDNPALALKYAPPIGDSSSVPRGISGTYGFDLFKIWSSLSLFQPSGNSGGIIALGDKHYELIKQYNETAQKLEAQGAFEDAAFVYLKLLNQPLQAAAVLERGQMYAEAAAVYLYQAKDKQKAAICYEKANMMEAAVNLYKELQQYEKVGDLFAQMGQPDTAKTWYNETVNEYLRKADYLNAATLMQNKVESLDRAQSILLRGWNESTKPTPCLQAYFGNITDDKLLLIAINNIISQLPEKMQQEQFMNVLATMYPTRPHIAEPIADIAFAVVAQYVDRQPTLVAMLRHFSPDDAELIKDAVRFKVMRGKV